MWFCNKVTTCTAQAVSSHPVGRCSEGLVSPPGAVAFQRGLPSARRRPVKFEPKILPHSVYDSWFRHEVLGVMLCSCSEATVLRWSLSPSLYIFNIFFTAYAQMHSYFTSFRQQQNRSQAIPLINSLSIMFNIWL